jgi:CxxC-x17-CxxC domain-containing protein
MFAAVCAKCGKKCEVPFKPTGDKPVYCSDCFGKGSKTSGQAPDQSKQQFEILNSKLDKILQALTPAVSLKAPKEKKTVKAKKESKKSKAVSEKVKTKTRKSK